MKDNFFNGHNGNGFDLAGDDEFADGFSFLDEDGELIEEAELENADNQGEETKKTEKLSTGDKSKHNKKPKRRGKQLVYHSPLVDGTIDTYNVSEIIIREEEVYFFGEILENAIRTILPHFSGSNERDIIFKLLSGIKKTEISEKVKVDYAAVLRVRSKFERLLAKELSNRLNFPVDATHIHNYIEDLKKNEYQIKREKKERERLEAQRQTKAKEKEKGGEIACCL